MAKQEITHESLQQKILQAELSLKEAQEEYKSFCKENPLQLPKQPTLHELRKQREKMNPTTAEDHAKSNAAAQAQVQKAAVIQAAKEAK